MRSGAWEDSPKGHAILSIVMAFGGSIMISNPVVSFAYGVDLLISVLYALFMNLMYQMRLRFVLS